MKDYLLDLVGMIKESAVDKINADMRDYRITREDNTNYMITCDFDMQRINLEIEQGFVVTAELG